MWSANINLKGRVGAHGRLGDRFACCSPSRCFLQSVSASFEIGLHGVQSTKELNLTAHFASTFPAPIFSRKRNSCLFLAPFAHSAVCRVRNSKSKQQTLKNIFSRSGLSKACSIAREAPMPRARYAKCLLLVMQTTRCVENIKDSKSLNPATQQSHFFVAGHAESPTSRNLIRCAAARHRQAETWIVQNGARFHRRRPYIRSHVCTTAQPECVKHRTFRTKVDIYGLA